MSNLWKRFALGSAIVVTVSLGAAGCSAAIPTADEKADSTSGADAATAAPEDDAPAEEVEEEDSAPTTSGALTADSFTEKTTTALLEARTTHMAMRMDFPGQNMSYEGDVEFDADPTKLQMSMVMSTTGANDMEIRYVNGSMYMNMGEASQHKFVEYSGDEASAMLSQTGGAGQGDLATQLEQFAAALRDFQVNGTENIDGVETTHYTLTVDTTELADESLQAQPLPDGTEFPDTIDYEMFVGPDDLIRRMSFELAGITATIDYSAWGEPVTVEAPPADQIIDQSGLGL